MTRVLVTGGTGFIGSHLVKGLTESGTHEVTVLSAWKPTETQISTGANYLEAGLDNTEHLKQILRENGIEVVYHLAWNSIHETSVKNTAADLEANLLGTVKLLEASRNCEVRRIVFMSSGGTVYGLPSSALPVNESHPTRPISAYGVTKLAAENYCGLYQHLYGLEAIILRPSVPYGPGQNPMRRQGAVSVFIDRALKSQPVTFWGDGTALRDYFYVQDMVNPMISAMTVQTGQSNIFNIGARKTYTLNELIVQIENALGLKIKVNHEPPRSFDVPKLHLDSSHAETNIGWHPVTSLQDGIRATANWLDRYQS